MFGPSHTFLTDLAATGSQGFVADLDYIDIELDFFPRRVRSHPGRPPSGRRRSSKRVLGAAAANRTELRLADRTSHY